MWNSQILNTAFDNGRLMVMVAYTRGDDKGSTFSEPIDMTGGSMDTLSRRVQNRIDTLNATDTLNAEIVTGPFTPVIPEPTPVEKLREAMRHLAQVKRATELGLYTAPVLEVVQPVTTDIKVDLVAEAQTAAQALFDPSLIDLI